MLERIVSWFLTAIHLGVFLLVAVLVLPIFAKSIDKSGGGYYWFTLIVGWAYCVHFANLTWKNARDLKVNTKQAAGKNNSAKN